jgi:hypothetical protein
VPVTTTKSWPILKSSKAVEDPYDLVLAIFGMVVAAVMLIAGELYLVTQPDSPKTHLRPSAVVTSAIERKAR